MNPSNNALVTPIYLKTDETMPWPDDKVFYLLSRDGLFLCRNHAFFSSCVAADRWPNELATQQPFMHLRYPRLPRQMIETVVGFFDIIAERHDSEAAVIVVWNRETKAIELVVPEQTATVGTYYYGGRYPVDLRYDIPSLPPHLTVIGDIHSHADEAAYASWTDKADEAYRPGLHLVVGRIREEPPQFYCAVIADGARFRVKDYELIMEGYQRRRRDEVPRDWLGMVSVEAWSSLKRRAAFFSERKGPAGLLPGNGDGEEVCASRSERTGPASANGESAPKNTPPISREQI